MSGAALYTYLSCYYLGTLSSASKQLLTVIAGRLSHGEGLAAGKVCIGIDS